MSTRSADPHDKRSEVAQSQTGEKDGHSSPRTENRREISNLGQWTEEAVAEKLSKEDSNYQEPLVDN